MRAITCPQCGAPLAPDATAVRVGCEHCGATIEVTSEGVARLAAKLERAGVYVSPRPMSLDDVHAEISEREGAERERTRAALVVVAVLVALGGLLALAAFALG